MGYKVHLTETCDKDTPHLITDVQTTVAPTADCELLPVIQANLAAHHRLPSEHLVDTGYVTAEQLVTSARTHQVELVGPVIPDSSWQARTEEGFDVTTFVIDWDAQTVTCPQGRVAGRGSPARIGTASR